MQRPTIAILGASGYAGVELTRLIALHPGLELVVAGSDRWANEPVEARIGVPAFEGKIGPGHWSPPTSSFWSNHTSTPAARKASATRCTAAASWEA